VTAGVRAVPVDVHRRHHQHRPVHGDPRSNQQEPSTAPREDDDNGCVATQRHLQPAAGACRRHHYHPPPTRTYPSDDLSSIDFGSLRRGWGDQLRLWLLSRPILCVYLSVCPRSERKAA